MSQARLSTTGILGWLLWRAGLLLAGGAALYYAAWWWLSTLRLPAPVKFSLGAMLVGSVLVVASLIMERRRDALTEGHLGD